MTGYRQSGNIIGKSEDMEKIFFPSWYYCRKSALGFPINIYERYCGENKTFEEFYSLTDDEGYTPFGYSELEFRDYSSKLDYNLNYSTLPNTDYDPDVNMYTTDRIPTIQCVYWLDNKGSYLNLERLHAELITHDFYSNTQETTSGFSVYKRPGLYLSMPHTGATKMLGTYYINDEKANFYGFQSIDRISGIYRYFDLDTVNPWYYNGASMINALQTIGQEPKIPPIAVFKIISRSWTSGYVDGQFKQLYLHLICFCCENLHPEVIL